MKCDRCHITLIAKYQFKTCIDCMLGMSPVDIPVSSMTDAQWWEWYKKTVGHNHYSKLKPTPQQIAVYRKLVTQELKENPDKYPQFKGKT